MRIWLFFGYLFLFSTCTLSSQQQTMSNNISAISLLTTPWGTENAAIRSKEFSPGGLAVAANTMLAPFIFQTGVDQHVYIVDPQNEYLSIFNKNQELENKIQLDKLSAYDIQSFQLIDTKRGLFLCQNSDDHYSIVLLDWKNDLLQETTLGKHKDVHLSKNNALGKRYCWTVNDDYSGQLHELTFGAEGVQVKALTSDFPFASSYVFVHEQEAIGIRYFPDLSKRGLEILNLLSKAHQTIPCDDALYGALLYPIGISATGLFACYQSPKEGLPLGRVYTLGLDGKLLKQYDLHEELGLSEDYKLIPYDNWTLQADGQLTVGAYSNAEVQVLQLDITR